MNGVKVIYIAGVPASGKTSIMSKIREVIFAESERFEHKKLKGERNHNYILLGVYDGSTFGGTDKLSHNVIDDAIEYIHKLQNEGSSIVVFAEGDRLFNERFLQSTCASVYVIDANERILRNRHNIRLDSQNETFLKGKRSQVENYIKKHGLRRIWNNTEADQKRIADYLIKKAQEYVEAIRP